MKRQRQWTFAFLGGRFDGYRHVADPDQVSRFQAPPDELLLWESGEVIFVREGDEPDVANEAERYCLRRVRRKELEAIYEHEKIHAGGRDGVGDELSLRDELERAVPEPIAA